MDFGGVKDVGCVGNTSSSHLKVKDAERHGVRGLAVCQEALVVEDAAHRAIGGRGLGLGGQGRGVWVDSLVQVSDAQRRQVG